MNKEESCKYFSPSTYCVCSSCKLDGKYTSCYGDKTKCKLCVKENKNEKR